jgi:hypothetical protein
MLLKPLMLAAFLGSAFIAGSQEATAFGGRHSRRTSYCRSTPCYSATACGAAAQCCGTEGACSGVESRTSSSTPSPEVLERLDQTLTRLDLILQVLGDPNRDGGVASGGDVGRAVQSLTNEIKDLNEQVRPPSSPPNP